VLVWLRYFLGENTTADVARPSLQGAWIHKLVESKSSENHIFNTNKETAFLTVKLDAKHS
jgi:hypothetical protein